MIVNSSSQSSSDLKSTKQHWFPKDSKGEAHRVQKCAASMILAAFVRASLSVTIPEAAAICRGVQQLVNCS
eukprot:467669-Amphidinium_carterae.2